MKNLREDLVNMILNEAINSLECECENGKECTFCLALILKGEHSQWELGENEIVKRTVLGFK